MLTFSPEKSERVCEEVLCLINFDFTHFLLEKCLDVECEGLGKTNAETVSSNSDSS